MSIITSKTVIKCINIRVSFLDADIKNKYFLSCTTTILRVVIPDDSVFFKYYKAKHENINYL